VVGSGLATRWRLTPSRNKACTLERTIQQRHVQAHSHGQNGRDGLANAMQPGIIVVQKARGPAKRPGAWHGPVRNLRATGGPARWPGGPWAVPSAHGPVAARSDVLVGPVVARRFGLLSFFWGIGLLSSFWSKGLLSFGNGLWPAKFFFLK
jgi:hypothetical protein